MEQNNFEQQVSTPMPPKPDNNLVLAIICTICCCLPLGIVGIVKANCLIREKVVTFRMVKLNLLLSIFCITK